jgi:hypothetical protein
MTNGQGEPDPSVELGTFEPRASWRIVAHNRARVLHDALSEAKAGVSDEHRAHVQMIGEAISRAMAAASYRAHGCKRIHAWYSGAAIQTAWSELHRASERLLLIQAPEVVAGRVREIDAELRSNLMQDDTRLKPATDRLADLARSGRQWSAGERQELRDYQEYANTASEKATAGVRSLRNLLIVIGGGVILASLLLAGLHAVAPTFIDLADHSTGARPDAPEVWEIELLGAVGGTVGAVFTISKLGGFSGPYRLPVYQALIRVPAGALIALVAVVLAQSGQIKAIGTQSGLGVLAVALVFGYAPDILLRFMDQRAVTLLGQAQTKDDPARPPLTKPTA